MAQLALGVTISPQRHRLNYLRRQRPGRPQLSSIDRFITIRPPALHPDKVFGRHRKKRGSLPVDRTDVGSERGAVAELPRLRFPSARQNRTCALPRIRFPQASTVSKRAVHLRHACS